MHIGICLPYMKAGLTREDYMAWFQAVDAGPFHSLCCGERVHGPAMDMRMLLAAAAAATSRVEISPTLYVLPMHNATRVAKEIASLDLLSGGRVRHVSVGYGGRVQDYEAVGAQFKGRYGRMDRQVAEMRRIWQGEEMVEGSGPIGPATTVPGGPQLIAGAMGPKSIERCAQWADGLYAWSPNGEQAELAAAFDMADAAWARAQRPHVLALLGRAPSDVASAFAANQVSQAVEKMLEGLRSIESPWVGVLEAIKTVLQMHCEDSRVTSEAQR